MYIATEKVDAFFAYIVLVIFFNTLVFNEVLGGVVMLGHSHTNIVAWGSIHGDGRVFP